MMVSTNSRQYHAAPRPTFRCALAMLLLAALLAACSSAPDPDTYIPPTTDQRTAIATIALEALDAPYRQGARGPDAFDNPGLIFHAYRSAGVDVPSDTREQLDTGKPVDLADAQPADLLFFRIENASGTDRLVVGLYMQPGEMLMASDGFAERSGVALFDIEDAFWQQRLVGVIRRLR